MPGIHVRPRVAGAGPEVWQALGTRLKMCGPQLPSQRCWTPKPSVWPHQATRPELRHAKNTCNSFEIPPSCCVCQ